MKAWLTGIVVCSAMTALGQQFSRDEIIALQVTLDDAGYSPGLIDGSFGSRTRQALVAWQSAHDLKPTGEFDVTTAAAFPAGGPVFTNITLFFPTGDVKPFPKGPRMLSSRPGVIQSGNSSIISRLMSE